MLLGNDFVKFFAMSFLLNCLLLTRNLKTLGVC